MKKPQKPYLPSKPRKPSLPEEPPKKVPSKSIYESIIYIDEYASQENSCFINKKDFLEKFSKLKDDENSGLEISYQFNDGYDYCKSSSLQINVDLVSFFEIDNPNYDRELIKHKKQLKKYNKSLVTYENKMEIYAQRLKDYQQKLAKYNEEMKEYELFVSQKEIEKLEKRRKKLEKELNK